MSWSYRIMRRAYEMPEHMGVPKGTKYADTFEYGIYEVYHDPLGWTSDPVPVTASSREELYAVLERMLEAASRNEPVLDYDNHGAPIKEVE